MVIALLAGCAPGPRQERAKVPTPSGAQQTQPEDASSEIRVSLKLDPTLTSGRYLGDRWVSPPVYHSTAQQGQVTVEARVVRIDRFGGETVIPSTWVPSDPEMVSVSPGQGDLVTIVVRHPGESTLQVTTQVATKTLTVQATSNGDTIWAEISQ